MGRFVLVGLVAGFASGMFGVGGGIIMVPLLVLVAHLDQRQASATSLFAIVPTALVGAIRYWTMGQIAWWPVVLITLGGVVGSHFGAKLMHRLRIKTLTWGFIGLQVVMLLTMILIEPTRAARVELGLVAAAGLVALGLVMGLCAGLFGVGGGIVAVPVLVGLFGAGDLLARGTSLLVMVPTAITGTVSNLRKGLVNVPAALATGIAATCSSLLGVQAAAAVQPRVGSIAFAALIAVSAVQLARKNLRR